MGYYSYSSKATSATATTLSSGSTSYSFNGVSAPSLEANVQGRSMVDILSVSVTYSGLNASDTADVYQEANAVVSSSTSTGNSIVIVPVVPPVNDNYIVSASPSSWNPSSGSGYTSVTVTATHDSVSERKDYYRVTNTTTWYTSNAHPTTSSTAITPYTSTTEGDSVEDTPSVSVNRTWITATTSQIKVSAQEPGSSQRSGLVTYTNNSASTTVTVTQKAGPIVYWVKVNGDTTVNISLDLAAYTEVQVTCGQNGASGGTWKCSVKYADRNKVAINNVSGRTSYTGSNNDWVKITCLSSKAEESITLSFTYGSGTYQGQASVILTPTGN